MGRRQETALSICGMDEDEAKVWFSRMKRDAAGDAIRVVVRMRDHCS